MEQSGAQLLSQDDEDVKVNISTQEEKQEDSEMPEFVGESGSKRSRQSFRESSRTRTAMPSPTRLYRSHKVLFSRDTISSSETCWDRLEAQVFAGVPPEYSSRRKLNMLLYKTRRGLYYDAIITILSLVACASYVAQTYTRVHPSATYTSSHLYTLDIVLVSVFTVDYLLRWYAAKQRGKYPFKLSAIVDALTILPVWFDVARNANTQVELLFLRFTRILRVLRIYKLFSLSRANSSAVSREVTRLFLIIICLLFVFSGLFHLVEGQLIEEISGVTRQDFGQDPITFGTAIYFLIVTTSTVGYGDISPVTDAGRLVVSLMIMMTFVLIPIQVNRLSELYNARSKYRTRVKRGDPGHVIVTGAVHDVSQLQPFFDEFLHPDRYVGLDVRSRDSRVIIVAPEEPSEELVNYLLSPILQARVRYIKASVVNDMDLHRIAADEADACFILAGRNPKRHELLDYQIMMRTLMIENFNPKLKTFVQLHQADSVQFLAESTSNESHVIHCLEEIRSRVLALGSVYPGTNTFLYNLLRSYSPHFSKLDGEGQVWLKEYCFGLGYEVYIMNLPHFYVGVTFKELVTEVYNGLKGFVQVIGLTTNGANHEHRGDRRRRTRTRRAKQTNHDWDQVHTNHESSDDVDEADPTIETVLAPDINCAIQSNQSVVVLAQSLGMAAQLLEYEFAEFVHKYRQNVQESNIQTASQRQSTMLFEGELSFLPGEKPFKENDDSSKNDSLDRTKVQPQRECEDDTQVNSGNHHQSNWNQVDNISQESSYTMSPLQLATKTRVSLFRSGSSRSNSSNTDVPGVKEAMVYVVHEVTQAKYGSGHLICVVPNLHGMSTFMESLSDMSLGCSSLVTHLVVVCPPSIVEDHPETVIELGSCGNVVFVLGDLSSPTTLSRAGVRYASSVTVFNNESSATSVDGELIDSHAIVAHLAVSKWRERRRISEGSNETKGFRTLIECNNTGSVFILERRRRWEERQVKLALRKQQLINEGQQESNRPQLPIPLNVMDQIPFPSTLTPSFFKKQSRNRSNTSGGLSKSAASEVDLVEPQVTMSPNKYPLSFTSATNRNASRTMTSAFRSTEGYRILPIYASGQASTKDEFTTLLCQAYFQPRVMHVIEALLPGTPEWRKSETQTKFPDDKCQLVSLAIPDRYRGATFGKLYLDILINHQCLAVAIYRHPSKWNMASDPYVFTCPPMETIVCLHDKVLLVGQSIHVKPLLLKQSTL